MGADFSNHQCFVGEAQPTEVRSALICQIQIAMSEMGYQQISSENQAERSFVIGPAERWIWIGDSAGSTETADSGAFRQLSLRLSEIAPVVDVLMSDSAAIHLYSYIGGELVDKYGNAAFPFFQFKTSEEASEFQGKPELWIRYLQDVNDLKALRSFWVQEWGADRILSQTMTLFGMNPLFYDVGYTHDDEGVPMKYTEYLAGKINQSVFNELHFQRS